MDCDHEPERISVVESDGTTVEIETECRHCGTQLWTSAELMAVGDYSVGDQFRDSEGRCWTILNPRTPGPAGSAGLKIEHLRDPLEERDVGVHLRANDGDEQWFQHDKFEIIVGDILEELP
ncbi:hypothetical protein [Halocatena halophila]|uniref:hypothetical protein n=1 Tax=Halocatena halophila TaxID=2814576 RepID=UPI002ED56F3D